MSSSQLQTEYYLKSPFHSPALNLALEEYLLKSKEQEFTIFYQNAPSVIVGKHQNVFAEVNYPFLMKEKIPVHRRLSGGGTVYHDWGNLNFCFITKIKSQKWIDFDLQVSPIVSFVESLNQKVEKMKNTSLFIHGKKFSGNAEHIDQKTKRVLHHGTLLVESNLDLLDKICQIRNNKYSDTGIKSIRSTVENLFTWTQIPIQQFTKDLIKHTCPKSKQYNLSKEDILKVESLAKEKYATWGWNYAYGPKFFKKVTFGSSELNIEINKGIIENCKWENKPLFDESNLIGLQFEWNVIKSFISSNKLDKHISTKLFV